VVPLTPTRKVIAERLVSGLRQTAPVTLTTRADATNLVNLREQFRAAAGPDGLVPGYTDFLLKLAAVALEKHPLLNAVWQGDYLLLPDGVHVGVAVDTEAGRLGAGVRGAGRRTPGPVAARPPRARGRGGGGGGGEEEGGGFPPPNRRQAGHRPFHADPHPAAVRRPRRRPHRARAGRPRRAGRAARAGGPEPDLRPPRRRWRPRGA